MGDAVGDDGVNWIALGECSEVSVVPESVAYVENWDLFDWGACYAMFVGECCWFDCASEGVVEGFDVGSAWIFVKVDVVAFPICRIEGGVELRTLAPIGGLLCLGLLEVCIGI